MNIPLLIVILYVLLLFCISIYVSCSQKKDSENFLLYKGKNISQILDFSMEEALLFFLEHKVLRRSVSRRTRLPWGCRRAGMIQHGRSARLFLLCWQSVTCVEASTRPSAVL